ncbi:MAG: hypothetical protein ACOZQL_42145 [Myxococcota bacterium]
MTANRPGSRWRFLAKDGERRIEAENDGIFDELVVDQWLHLEQMDDDTWWMRLGDARVDIKVGPDGVAEVSIERGVYQNTVA